MKFTSGSKRVKGSQKWVIWGWATWCRCLALLLFPGKVYFTIQCLCILFSLDQWASSFTANCNHLESFQTTSKSQKHLLPIKSGWIPNVSIVKALQVIPMCTPKLRSMPYSKWRAQNYESHVSAPHWVERGNPSLQDFSDSTEDLIPTEEGKMREILQSYFVCNPGTVLALFIGWLAHIQYILMCFWARTCFKDCLMPLFIEQREKPRSERRNDSFRPHSWERSQILCFVLHFLCRNCWWRSKVKCPCPNRSVFVT